MRYEILREATKNFERTGMSTKDIVQFLHLHKHQETARHSAQVAQEARKLACRFGENQEAAYIAGWLHDISAIFPNEQRITVAKSLDIDFFPEEEIFPMIIHQKISQVMAQEIFGVTDKSILSAIGCHTTLKKNPSQLDKVVFVADKIRWDQQGDPPYMQEILSALEISLDHAAFCYLDFLWSKRTELKVIHPWLAEAHHQLSQELRHEK